MVAKSVIAELSQRIRRMERSAGRAGQDHEQDLLPCTLPGLDQLLCAAGWPRGCLIEWLAEGHGTGSASVALLASRSTWRDGVLVVIDSHGELYAPGALPFAVDVASTVFVRPKHPPDMLWSLEQALRTRGVGAVVCDIEQLSSKAARRLQLAAESSGSVGILLRPERARRQPSFAEYRFLVRPWPRDRTDRSSARRWRVELLRARGKCPAGALIVEFDDGPRGLCVAAELASATSASRAAGA